MRLSAIYCQSSYQLVPRTPKSISLKGSIRGHPTNPIKNLPTKGPFRTVFSTESDSALFYYFRVVNLLRVVIHYAKYSKSVQNVVIHYIFSGESLCVVNSLQIVNSLRVPFLVCRGPTFLLNDGVISLMKLASYYEKNSKHTTWSSEISQENFPEPFYCVILWLRQTNTCNVMLG